MRAETEAEHAEMEGMSKSPRHAKTTFTPPPDLEDLQARRTTFKSATFAKNTLLSYERDWRVFRTWCDAAGRQALPATPETVELYCTDLIARGRKVSTADRHCRGILYAHRQSGHETPISADVRKLLRGARRQLGQPLSQKDAIGVADLRAMVAAIGTETAIGARNCALLVFGFASALRRSSLARLQLADLVFGPEGLRVTIRHEKTDRDGKPREIGIPPGQNSATCPVELLRNWLKWRGETPGPVFVRVLNRRPGLQPILGNRLCQIVQESVARIGLDRRRFGAHSLRAGFVTEALERGENEVTIARHTGHRSLDTLRLYLRSRSLFRANACRGIGL